MPIPASTAPSITPTLLLSLILIVFLAPVDASAPTTKGSYDEPHIIDPAGDVSHPDFYTGKRSVDSYDLLRSWTTYNETTDTVEFTMHIVDATEWAVPDESDTFWCRESMTVEVAGDVMGRLSVGWRRNPGPSPLFAYATFLRNGSEDALAIPSTNQTSLQRPGNLTIFIDRPALAVHGETLGQIDAACQILSPLIAPQTGVSIGSADLANATVDYDLSALSPSVENRADGDGMRPRGAKDPGGSISAGTPGVGTLAVSAAACIAVSIGRFRIR